jgi:Rieske Fe-S protein
MSTTHSPHDVHKAGGTPQDAADIINPEGHGMDKDVSLLDADFIKHPLNRRNILMWVGVALNTVVGLAIAAPVVGYVLGPALKKKDAYKKWVSLGQLGKFPNGQTRLAEFTVPIVSPTDGQTANQVCWVRRLAGEQFQVFAVNCAHLDCPVRWFPQSGLFMCPCHGGVYYQDGSRAAGPPERGLFEYKWKVTNGELQIFAGQLPTLSTSAKLVRISPCQQA